ncbi:toprim domain-containing protein [Fusobacterium perfoetens]|uniref:toprim domain-containing protein n=1 Tax=Fusobacterium perfoetens TaxID=852 RepID=UPI001F170500|nr:toprim domain-containing protein [Fusobacterium perfoetens]MCF2612441.1 toprim domain-containing protein [Fusobacterium perfoetens]
MNYNYTRQGNQLRFKYCPICDKVKENPDFTINIAEGVYFCFSNNIGGRVEDLSKYGFDIGEIPELRRFYRVETKNNGSLRGDNPLNSKDSSLNGDIKKYYKEEGKNSKDFARDIENKDRCLGGEIPQDFKDGSLGGDKTLSNGRANNFTDNNSFNKEIKKNIDLTSIFLARKDKFLNDEWIKYLASRGISDKYLKKFARLGKSNTMMMPLTNGKKVIGIKYRTIDKKIFSERESQSDYLLGWQLVKDFSYVIIVEGEIDLLSALEVGFESVVSLPFGAGNLKSIEHQKDWLSSFEKIIIATDNDTQGKKSKDEIIKILSSIKSNKDKLFEVDLGIYKDFNEVLTSGLKNKSTDNKSDNINQTYLSSKSLENKPTNNLSKEINLHNNTLENRLTNNQLNETNQTNQDLINLGKERLIKIIDNPIKINFSEDIKKDLNKKISPFSKGEDGYYYNLTTKITDFLLRITKFSDNYIGGFVITNGREREFFAKKTDLITKNGILENIGYFLGSITIIPNFWSWILEENAEKYIEEIEHYGIINDKYYDPTSPVICSKADLKIKPLEEIKDFTDEEKFWLDENLLSLRKDRNESLLGICWALGRFHIDGAYPILEVSGTTSIGKTEFIEFISRIMFGTRENIKSLVTLSNHQIRSFSSCSNITPWAIDEVKITGSRQKEKAEDLYATIRSVYDNKTINQGNITSKLTEFKLCTPLIISGESELSDVSVKNRMISIKLTKENKCESKIFNIFKTTDYLEKLGKYALFYRLNREKIKFPQWEVRYHLQSVDDERQLYNGLCIFTGLRALECIIPLKDEILEDFYKFLNKKLSNYYTPTANFLELLELVKESGKDTSLFYQIKGDRHFVRFSLLYKAIAEEHLLTNSTLELLDMRGLKRQLIEEGFIINDRVSVRFPKGDFTKENIIVKACEIMKNDIFKKDFLAID